MKQIRIGEKIVVSVKPCPQCGREDLILVGQGGLLTYGYRVKCGHCRYEVGSLDLGKAVKMWNTSEVGKK